MKSWTFKVAALTLAMSASAGAFAQEVTLRLHQFLPPQGTVPSKALTPWTKKIEEESKGRIKIQMYSSMQLGGTPPQLFDQARDGVVDIVWTLQGYTPGRFPKTEVFELPFIAGLSAEKTSRALWDYVQKNAMDEYKDVHVLALHTHGPGLFHTKQPVTGLESLRGMKIRGGTRVVNNMLVKLGATPVGMPVPAVTEALSKGVLDGTTIPWEVAPALKVQELVKNHTTFAGDRALYVTTFVVAMNKSAYHKLPADLKKVIDDNSGAEFSALIARTQDVGDNAGRDLAVKAGNTITELDKAEVQRWRRTAGAVEADWLKDMKGKNIDGDKLVSEAKALIANYEK
ncbi:TRAP-type C4-dicarboxylate transport system substrate-binding protein [Hydrogenophaga palleronii]|uniref:TRAP-type C4-dicarboxylate transport system substrate-binding protein n=1 Tax=Hydrogenophaga palleronii TaxID=65655 RepID=A0ABU1WJ70_9BURK|nr:TRAP transporter substrate-binding protein [Hydrogenophaga palleronii]MDR7149012.1 TRAP-type C4-dicarboxylate transport system substrate-binding protein [Hydrogenophaga palleronii]